jgi:lysophospholipase L1-like esterase
LYGTQAVVNVPDNRLELYVWDGASSSSLGKQVAAGFTFVVGRRYDVRLERTGAVNTMTLVDKTTHQTVSLSAEADDSTGRCWGNPGVIIREGTVRVLDLQYVAHTDIKPRVVWPGDSITERNNLGVDWESGFVSLFADQTGLPSVVSARGGSSSSDLLARAPIDILAFRPEFLHILIGTNERGSTANLPLWKSNVSRLIDMGRQIGAKVVIGTLPPADTGAAFIGAANDYIRAGSFGSDVTVVDYSQALTVGNDRVTQNTSLFLSDQVHPNVAGHAAMFEQIKADVPAMFY